MPIVLILGGFHMMMSFAGSIGTLMAGSGLSSALETSYGPISINHMLSGKAIAMFMRANFKTESALMALLLPVIMEEPAQKENLTTNVSEDETEPTETTCWNQVILEKNPNLRTLTATEIIKLFSLLDLVEDDYETGIETVAKSEEFKLLRYMIDCLMGDLQKISLTAKLWLQYISYIQRRSSRPPNPPIGGGPGQIWGPKLV